MKAGRNLKGKTLPCRFFVHLFRSCLLLTRTAKSCLPRHKQEQVCKERKKRAIRHSLVLVFSEPHAVPWFIVSFYFPFGPSARYQSLEPFLPQRRDQPNFDLNAKGQSSPIDFFLRIATIRGDCNTNHDTTQEKKTRHFNRFFLLFPCLFAVFCEVVRKKTQQQHNTTSYARFDTQLILFFSFGHWLGKKKNSQPNKNTFFTPSPHTRDTQQRYQLYGPVRHRYRELPRRKTKAFPFRTLFVFCVLENLIIRISLLFVATKRKRVSTSTVRKSTNHQLFQDLWSSLFFFAHDFLFSSQFSFWGQTQNVRQRCPLLFLKKPEGSQFGSFFLNSSHTQKHLYTQREIHLSSYLWERAQQDQKKRREGETVHVFFFFSLSFLSLRQEERGLQFYGNPKRTI